MELDLPEKTYYSIGEVAKAFKVKTSTLRHWEKEFKQIKPKKKKNGIRKYTIENVRTIQYIHHLTKEKKLTLSGVKKVLAQGSQSEREKKSQIIAVLREIREELNEIRDAL